MNENKNLKRRQRTFRAQAVVLKHKDWGEADRLLSLYTLEFGKIQAIAKGVRKLKSRKAGHLEPFTLVNLMFAKGRDLQIITQADTITPYISLHSDLLLTTYASYVVELLDRFTYGDGENRALFRLLVNTLERLNKSDNVNLAIRYYEIRLMDLVGFRPQLFNCIHCGAEIQPVDQFFSIPAGGVVCPKCKTKVAASRPVSMNALKYMRHFQRSDYKTASKAKLTTTINQEIENLMQNYITYQLEQSLNTPPFIRRVQKSNNKS